MVHDVTMSLLIQMNVNPQEIKQAHPNNPSAILKYFVAPRFLLSVLFGAC